ncbi:MAG TPA: hypothetical protein DEE98_07225 [Elusimicrobia bacterium]|nr:MAG: hypothetical protein A2278_00140 [Elusimicrobia bacterium RIFOXYA12_FULL_49_49]OGS09217.1 MAG: hypothetical protein A2204_00970 [Elusimicrobia bacterium RIFOXYA1_FULL_47_7]OGS11465.1 MAG: hypothetical protein A2386_00075 [Elusimicrobia bacterium RIFOXYB1_FULL_48_9]OGS15845.1 MAG: hypothetical protein A2251_04275 [Elusimicrobia bacterium RIFOXYA2_FULL_47_53]OGS27139.1 MAG: hypothetical protein A2339_00525 [Elusimicrobia bacterium RIFOXYB12_FULL_50_12]OGS31177.1 MAG: hypothetical protein
MDFKRIFSELNKRDIKYLVAGGIAVNLYGFVRATSDLDIMLRMSDENVGKLMQLFQELGFKPRVPVNIHDFADKSKRGKWIKEKGMIVFSVYNPKNEMEGIDIMIEEFIDFNKAYEKRVTLMNQGVKVPVVSIEDLIRLKVHAGRVRDLSDVEALKEIINASKKGK